MGINFVFKYCDTQKRFYRNTEDKSPIKYAIDVSNNLLRRYEIPTDEIGLIIYGGIYRDYFEPATAMEIASGIGIKNVAAFDVTNACAGLLQSVMVAASLMQSNSDIKYALCCTTDFPDEAIDYNIQTFSDLSIKSAGLTLGSAASAWLLGREIFNGGSALLKEFVNTSIPHAHSFCRVPVVGKKFESLSSDIFDMGIEYMPKEIHAISKLLGWDIADIDLALVHQPGAKIIENVCNKIGISLNKTPIIHHLYGNTVNSSVPMVMDFVSKTRSFKDGDKIIFNSAAAGFTMVTGAAIWKEGK